MNKNLSRIKEIIDESLLTTKLVNPFEIEKATKIILSAYKNKKKTIWFGNGGSASDAQHITAELVGRFKKERRALPALCINTNTSSMTAVSNDYSFLKVFERQIEAYGNPGDVAIGITTSGKSKNVILALALAKKLGCITIGLCGTEKKHLRGICDLVISVPSSETPRIQEAHILIGHIICSLVEEKLFGEK